MEAKSSSEIIEKLLRNRKLSPEETDKLDYFWEYSSNQQKKELIKRIGRNLIPAVRKFTVSDLVS